MSGPGRQLLTVLGVVLALTVCPPSTWANVRSQALYARGLVPFNSGKWDDAYRLFDQAVQADRADAMAVYYRGLTQARRGLPTEAIRDLEQALKLNPALPHAALDLGIEHFNTTQYADAKVWLERAHQQESDRPTAAFFLGLTLYRLGDENASQPYFEEAKADPDLRSAAQYYSGVLLLRQGKTEAAKTELAEVARTQPQSELGQLAQRYTATAEVRQPPPAASERRKPWSVFAQGGFDYDTNVVAGPSESPVGSQGVSRKGDGAITLGLGGDYTLLDTNIGSVRAAYDFYQSIHFSLTEFDLQGHRLRLDLASKPGIVTYGLAGSYDFYALDYKSFFQEALGTPWVAVNEGQAAVTQVYYTIRGRDFFRRPFDPGRDGLDQALGARQNLELGDRQRVLSFGYQYDSEDTVSDGPMGNDFEYTGNQLDIGLTLPVLDAARLQLAYLFRIEDYQFINSRPNSDGSRVRRHDGIHQFVVGGAYDLTTNVALTLDFIGIINNSNIPDFDYDRDIVSAGVRVTF